MALYSINILHCVFIVNVMCSFTLLATTLSFYHLLFFPTASILSSHHIKGVKLTR